MTFRATCKKQSQKLRRRLFRGSGGSLRGQEVQELQTHQTDKTDNLVTDSLVLIRLADRRGF